MLSPDKQLETIRRALRNRRFKELLGERWETVYYENAPDEVEVFTETEE